MIVRINNAICLRQQQMKKKAKYKKFFYCNEHTHTYISSIINVWRRFTCNAFPTRFNLMFHQHEFDVI